MHVIGYRAFWLQWTGSGGLRMQGSEVKDIVTEGCVRFDLSKLSFPWAQEPEARNPKFLGELLVRTALLTAKMNWKNCRPCRPGFVHGVRNPYCPSRHQEPSLNDPQRRILGAA